MTTWGLYFLVNVFRCCLIFSCVRNFNCYTWAWVSRSSKTYKAI